MSGIPSRRVVRTARRHGGGAGSCLLALTLIASCLALPAPNARAQAPQRTNREYRMLVMNTGRVIEGWISQSAGGYMVDLPKGNMFVPFEQVRFEAEDKSDAYRKMRRSMPDLTANNHLALARWCLANHQYRSARTEVLDALSLEPAREEARQMLKRIEQQLNSQDAPVLEQPHGLQSNSRFANEEVKALAGLSRETADHFVLRIQPLLLNKCGNAKCHGPNADSEFRLRHQRGSSRAVTEQNLAKVLKLIDSEAPDASPLLTTPAGNHGQAGRAIFFGRSGKKQIDDLRKWTFAVIREEYRNEQARLAQQERIAQRRGRKTPQKGVQSAAASVTESGRDMRDSGVRQTSHSQVDRNTGRLEPTAQGRQLIDEVLSEETDPFSPEAFNRGSDRPSPSLRPASHFQSQSGGQFPAMQRKPSPEATRATSGQPGGSGASAFPAGAATSANSLRRQPSPRQPLPQGSGYPFQAFPQR